MQKNASTANSALWVIALSLAVIAACLVALVCSQQRAAETKVPETAVQEPVSRIAAAPVRHLPVMQVHQVAPPEAIPSPAPPPEPVVEAVVAPEPPVAVASAPQPIVSGGLAPLTSLTVTNGVTVIAGRVTLKGTPPPETGIPMDAICGKGLPSTNTTHRYLVSPNGGLANVFVYIRKGLEGKQFVAPNEPVVVNQTGCLYEPYVLGLMVNQKLRVKNSDHLLHNLHSRPTVRGNDEFNMAEAFGMVVTKTFQSPEIPLRLMCDVHPWMISYICVVDNPFFAVTDAEGNYSISNVPPGGYVLEAYHVKAHGRLPGEEERITVTAGKTTTANFTIDLGANKRIAQSR